MWTNAHERLMDAAGYASERQDLVLIEATELPCPVPKMTVAWKSRSTCRQASLIRAGGYEKREGRTRSMKRLSISSAREVLHEKSCTRCLLGLSASRNSTPDVEYSIIPVQARFFELSQAIAALSPHKRQGVSWLRRRVKDHALLHGQERTIKRSRNPSVRERA